MYKQPKIHIFFGAPIITTGLKSSEQNSSVQDSSTKWEEFQFLYDNNRPCSSTTEKTNDCYDDKNVRIKEGCFVRQSVNSDTCPSKGTSTVKSHRLSSACYNEVLCDSLREYLEGTFSAEPPKSSPPCRPSKTSRSEVSAETEYLCVMTASQTAVQIQGQCNVQAHSAETENNKEVRDEDVTLHQNKETFPSTNSFEGLQR
ncbi:uncharacterized protein LOC122788726 [Protopterus annectens]|uniref:uncharacterized protein LOC122788726 n=1 Tax=Protopterus annectens TaxID=7888 RepID=UPI001CFA6C74|nr:uncharacterized protein LOC122788726 [Protopterus annectens]